MSFNERMIRLLLVGSIYLFSQVVPAFAEKITLACSAGPGYIILYLTIDTDAKTVKDLNGTFPAQITEDAVLWKGGDGGNGYVFSNRYDRQRATVCGAMTNSDAFCTRYATPGLGGAPAPVPCVRAPPRPF